jgi:hypothetical protein
MVRKDHEVTVYHRGRKLSEEYKTYVTATTDEWFDEGEVWSFSGHRVTRKASHDFWTKAGS